MDKHLDFIDTELINFGWNMRHFVILFKVSHIPAKIY
jgi:hypothetical protein